MALKEIGVTNSVIARPLIDSKAACVQIPKQIHKIEAASCSSLTARRKTLTDLACGISGLKVKDIHWQKPGDKPYTERFPQGICLHVWWKSQSRCGKIR